VARRGLRRRGSFAYVAELLGAPRVTCPLLASATSPAGMPRSSLPCWPNEFRDHFAAVRHQHLLAGPHFPNVLAQSVFQFPKAHAFHDSNVAL